MSIQVSPSPISELTSAVLDRDAYLTGLLNNIVETRSVASLQDVWLQELRDRAALWVRQSTLPTTRDEEWRFTDLSSLRQVQFNVETRPIASRQIDIAPLTLPEAVHSRLVFVNGVYAPELSAVAGLPDGVVVSNLAGLPVETRSRVREYLACASGSQEVFTALNTTGMSDVAVVWVAKNVVVETPIHLLFISAAGETPTLCFPRCLVVAESGSQVSLVEEYMNRQDEQRIRTDVTDELTVERRDRASAISATTLATDDITDVTDNLTVGLTDLASATSATTSVAASATSATTSVAASATSATTSVAASAISSTTSVAQEAKNAKEEVYFTNAVTEIWLEDNAQVSHVRVQQDGESAFHVGKSVISQGRYSRYICNAICFGGKVSRHNLEILQTGEQTETTLNGLTMIGGNQLADTHSTIALNYPHGTSRQLHKCIVGDRAHSVFNGKIFVPKPAQLTDATQLNRNLLLSSKARVDTKPQLEITADNVKCAHGATVSQLEDDEIFYLQSRGIDENDARNLLINAFAAEIINQIPVPSLRERLTKFVNC